MAAVYANGKRYTNRRDTDGDETCSWHLVSDSKAVTVTVGGQQDKEEDAVAAVPIGQIPAAQQLRGRVPGFTGREVTGVKVKGGHTGEREAITDGLESQIHETTREVHCGRDNIEDVQRYVHKHYCPEPKHTQLHEY